MCGTVWLSRGRGETHSAVGGGEYLSRGGAGRARLHREKRLPRRGDRPLRGVDSALTLAIAVDAIGAGRVEAVMMPSRYTAQMSLDDAERQAKTLGVEYHVISIEPAFNAFLASLQDELAGTAPDTTEENIQARCRGVILMAISNKKVRFCSPPAIRARWR